MKMITALPKRSGTEPRAVASGLKTQPAVLTEGAIAADRDTEQVQISTRVLVPLAAARGSVASVLLTDLK